MTAAKHTPHFEVTEGCEEFIVIDGNGYTMAKCEARFDLDTREFSGHSDAKERAEQIAAALNVAYYLAKAVGAGQ